MKRDPDTREEEELTLLLGVPCPLCTVSYHVRVGELDGDIARRIQQDFPRWTPEAGACEQCIELYTPRRLI